MSKKNLCIIASVVIAISAFLPFASVSFLGSKVSKSLIDGGDGYFVLAIALIALICSLNEKYIPTVISGAISLVLFIVENKSFTSSLEDDDLLRALIQNEAGYYMLLIGSIALMVFAFMANTEKSKAKAEEPHTPSQDF